MQLSVTATDGVGGCFLKVSGSLVLMHPRRYESEDLLQQALEQLPEVLAGPTTTA